MTATLNRPEALNATDEMLHRELSSVFANIARDKATWAVVLTGAGKALDLCYAIASRVQAAMLLAGGPMAARPGEVTISMSIGAVLAVKTTTVTRGFSKAAVNH